MSININLVDKKSPEDSRLERIKKLRGISFVVLFLTALSAILIFGIDYRFSASYVKKQQSDILKEIASFGESSAKVFIVNTKLSDLSTLIEQRKKYGEVTAELVAAGNSNITIEEFLFDENGATLTASASSLQDIDNFLNSLMELADKKTLTNVTLRSLSFDLGRYVVEVSAI